MTPQVGQDFGGYRIDAELGRGGMGVVFRAWQYRLRRPVALKVLAADVADEPGYRERFDREADVLARLDSPHVIQILDHGEEDGQLYLAMQLVHGPDLASEYRRRPLSPDRALGVVAQVASALGDAHAVDVLHRDVKPANVLLRTRAAHDDADFAYLCDFGIATSVADASLTGERGAGTRGFLSPERLNGEAASAKSDVYALGCLLWVVLTGVPPYPGNAWEVMRGHMEEPPPRLVDDGDPRTVALNGLIADMMAKQRDDRPEVRQIRDRIRELSAVPRARTTTAAPARDDPPGGAGSRRRSRRALLAGGAALAAVAAVAAIGLTPPDGPPPADRIAAATPTAATGCRPVDPAPDDVDARSVCSAGPGVGELQISALGSASAAEDHLDVVAGRDVGRLTAGRCPDDLPARERWERGAHSGTLVCVTTGSGTRYAWSDASTATVSVLDGAPDRAYPADLPGVRAFVADLRFGSG